VFIPFHEGKLSTMEKDTTKYYNIVIVNYEEENENCMT
jgi:hypothetical protein